MVDIETNPLYYAATGGIILGIATSLHYVLKGNVTGLSGIIYDVAFFNLNEFPNKLIILGGIIIASGIFFDIFGYGSSNNFTPFGQKQMISQKTSYLGFALAGLLVGFGTKLGNGCTSGHGLCGLARLSIRSFVAVMVFLASAIAISTIRYYFTLGPFSEGLSPQLQYEHLISSNICIFLGVCFLVVGFVIQKIHTKQNQQTSTILRDNFISLLVGFIFGCGLLVAGMVRRRNIMSFLQMGKDWNPSLLFVLGCGVMVNLVIFNYMIRVKKEPVFGAKLFNPDNKVIDWKLVVGATSFGLGWGIGGICPGPAVALLPVFQVQIHVIWIATLVLGMFLAVKLVSITEKQATPEPRAKIQIQLQKHISVTNQIIGNQQNNIIPLDSKIVVKSNQNQKKQQKLEKPKQQKEEVESYNLDNLNMDSNAQLKPAIGTPTRTLQGIQIINLNDEEIDGK